MVYVFAWVIGLEHFRIWARLRASRFGVWVQWETCENWHKLRYQVEIHCRLLDTWVCVSEVGSKVKVPSWKVSCYVIPWRWMRLRQAIKKEQKDLGLSLKKYDISRWSWETWLCQQRMGSENFRSPVYSVK